MGLLENICIALWLTLFASFIYFIFTFVFMQVIIKDSSIVLTLAHIKAYMLQTFLGLEYLHAHWILHRVS